MLACQLTLHISNKYIYRSLSLVPSHKFIHFLLLPADGDGQTSVKFGVLFSDERCANIFEALVGTLKAAKKRKVVDFQSELLLQGVHDNVDIVLLQE